MAKIYLEAGREFQLSGGPVRVGASSTVVDAIIDWVGVGEYNRPITLEPHVGDYVVGAIVDRGTTFDIRLEKSTGRLWYDDARGY